jgi:hypothetical protein
MKNNLAKSNALKESSPANDFKAIFGTTAGQTLTLL